MKTLNDFLRMTHFSKLMKKMANCLCADCFCEMTRTAARFKRKITFNTR